MSLSSKKAKIWLISIGTVLLSTILVLSGVGLFFKFNPDKIKTETKGDPLDFSIDAWDGKSSGDNEYNVDYAGRGTETRTIDSAESFIYFIEEVNSGSTFEGLTVYLNKSIDLKGHTIESIGNKANPFKGTFDGGFYTLYNLNIKGNGLFGQTENATIKNIGLYNPTINSTSKIAGGLIGTAINTKVENTFVNDGKIKGEQVGGLVGEYIITETTNDMTSFAPTVEAKISNSFADTAIRANSIGGLVHTLTTENEDEILTIDNSYFVTGENAVASFETTSLETTQVIKPVNKQSFKSFDYKAKYEKGGAWCDYENLQGSRKHEFNYPVQSGFVKVYLTGSHYESVIITEDKVVDISNLSDALTEINNSTQEAVINVIVEKVFVEARAEARKNTNVTINAVEDTTLVRGEHNTDSMFVATENSKIVIGGNTQTLSESSVSSGTITLDGNREQVEKENLESGALVVGYGGTVEIGENVVLQNNVNTNVKYGGAILLYNIEEEPIIKGTIENCSAEYGGGGICLVNVANATLPSINNCSSQGHGGAISILSEIEDKESARAMVNLYGGDSKVVPLATNVTSAGTYYCSSAGYSGNSGTYGGALYVNITTGTKTSLTIRQASGATLKTQFTNNKARQGGGIYIKSVSSSSSTGSVTVSNCAFTGNKATGYYSSSGGIKPILPDTFASIQPTALDLNEGKFGGAICEIATTCVSLTISNCSLSENGYGVAASNDSKIAFANGGAVYSTGNVLASNSTFTSNYSKGGGAIDSTGNVSCDGSTFESNQAKSGSAGAISADSVSLSATTFTSNSATINGGAIFADTIKMDRDCTFNRNSALGSGKGGAIFADTILCYQDFEGYFSENSSYGNGGAIYSGSVWLSGLVAEFTENTSTNGYGGAIYADEVILDTDDPISFTANSANCGEGGAVYAAVNMEMAYGGANFYSNSAGLNGGAIYLEAGQILFDQDDFLTFELNSAKCEGGAIYVYEGHLDFQIGAIFMKNSARNGGAIYFTDHGSMNTADYICFGDEEDSTKGNTATTNGGAIYIERDFGPFDMCEFYYNSAGLNGGGIYIDGTIETTDRFYFVGNSAASGGAIYSNCGTIDIKGSYFGSNTASVKGGAIYTESGGSVWQNAYFYNNTSTKFNGGTDIAVGSGCELEMGLFTFSESGSAVNIALGEMSSLFITEEFGPGLQVYQLSHVIDNPGCTDPETPFITADDEYQGLGYVYFYTSTDLSNAYEVIDYYSSWGVWCVHYVRNTAVEYDANNGLITLEKDKQSTTTYKINWANNFSVATTFSCAGGTRYFVFGNYNGVNHLNIEITAANKIRVYINNANVDKTLSNTIPLNTPIAVKFTWTASSKAWSFTASAFNWRDLASGTSTVTGTSAYALAVGRDYRGTGTFGAINIGPLRIATGSGSEIVYPYTSRNQMYGSVYSGYTTPNRSGHTFNGWLRNVYDPQTMKFSGSDVSSDDIITIYEKQYDRLLYPSQLSLTGGKTYYLVFDFVTNTFNQPITIQAGGSTAFSSVSSQIPAATKGRYIVEATTHSSLASISYTLWIWTPNTVTGACTFKLGVYEKNNYVTKATTAYETRNNTLFAQWTVNTNTLQYTNYNGNLITHGTIAYGEVVKLKSRSELGYDTWTKSYNFYNTDGSTAASTISVKGVFSGWTPSAYAYSGYWGTSSTTVTTVIYPTSLISDSAYIQILHDTAKDQTITMSTNITFASITLPTPTKAGYTFNGWYDAASGGNKIGVAGAAYTGNVTSLYARWTANSYTMTYTSGGGTIASNGNYTGSGTNATKSLTYGTAYTTQVAPSSSTLKRPGYGFGGYYVGTDYKNSSHATGYLTSAQCLRLNAGTYNSNVFTAGMTIGVDVTIAGAKITGIEINDIAVDVTQYELLESESRIIAYMTVTSSQIRNSYSFVDILVAANGTYTVTVNEFWTSALSTQLTDTSGILKASVSGYTGSGKQWQKAAAVFAVPKWTQASYTVTYNANGGSVSPASKTISYNNAYSTLATPTRAGYTFNGWSTNLYNQNMRIYRDGYYYNGNTGAYVSYAEYDCYRVYVLPNTTYTITNSGGSTAPGYGIFNSAGTCLAYKNYANTVTVTFTTPANASYVVFSVVTDSTSSRYDKTTFKIYGKVDSTIRMLQPSGHTLDAGWTVNSYTAILDNSSATTAGTTSKTVTYNSTVPTGITIPSRSGYAFAGYYGVGSLVTVTGTGTLDSAGAQVRKSFAIGTFVQGNTIAVSFKSNVSVNSLEFNDYGFGTSNTPGYMVQYNTGGYYYIFAYATISVDRYPNQYCFVDINCSASATISDFVAGKTRTQFYTSAGAPSSNKYTIPSNTMFVSDWTANSYTVTANANGGSIPSTSGWSGTGATATKSVTYDSTYGTLPTPTRIGYAFDGWGIQRKVTNGNKTTISADGYSVSSNGGDADTYFFVRKSNGTEETLTVGKTYRLSFYCTISNETAWTIAPQNNGDYAFYLKNGYNVVIFKATETRAFFDDHVRSASVSWTISGITLEEVGAPSITSSTTVKTASAHNIYAQWTANTYTVSFNSGGGSSVSAVTRSWDTAYGTLPTPTRTGYIFNGWYFTNDSTTPYKFVDYIQATGTQYIDTGVLGGTGVNIEVTAQASGWTGSTDYIFAGLRDTSGNRFWIDYGCSGGYQRMLFGYGDYFCNSSYSPDINSIITAKLDTQNNKGYVNGVANISLTAKTISKTLNIYLFGANDKGSAGLFAKGKIYGAKIWDNGTLVRDMRPCVKSDGTVGMMDLVEGKFYTNAGSGTFTAGTTLTDVPVYSTTKLLTAANHTLESKWTPHEYTVAYNGNGSTSGSTASSYHTYGVAKNLTANGYAKQYAITFNPNGGSVSTSSGTASAAFSGWATSASGNVVYTDKQSVSNLTAIDGGTVTLYAKWGDAKLSSLPTPTRTGYTFKGWFTATSGGTQITTSTAFTANGSIYAQWTANSHNVTLDDGTYIFLDYISSSGTQYIDTGIAMNSNVSSEFKFAYNQLTNSEAYVFGGDIYPYPLFGAISGGFRAGIGNSSFATWALDTNVHVVNHSATSIKVDGTSKATGSGSYALAYNYFLFAGNDEGGANYFTNSRVYYLKMYNGGTLIRDMVPVKRKSDNAIGMFDKVNSVFYANSGSGSFTAGYKQATYGSTYGTLPTPVKSGNTFKGWYTAASGGTKVESTTTVSATSAHTLYAQWQVNGYTVTYNANGGNNNILLNSSLESVSTNSSIGWDNSINGTTVANSWSNGFNSGVESPTIGYHAHVYKFNNNYVVRFKTNEDYDHLTDTGPYNTCGQAFNSLRWLGFTQGLGTKLIAGHTYRWTMDVYRKSGAGQIHGGPYYKTTSNNSNAFQSGTLYFKPSTNSVWETVTNTFTMASDYNKSDVTLYMYGMSAEGEIYADNIILEDITSGVSQTSTASIAYGAKYTLPASNPVRTGYTFKGWYTAASGGTQITSSTTMSTASAHTLYAQWTAIQSNFNRKWKAVMKKSLNTTNTQVKTIQFVSGTTLPSGFIANQYFFVGSPTRSSTQVNASVLAYWYKDNSNFYHLAFISPSGGTIYAPSSCSSLFYDISDKFTNLTTLTFANFNTSSVTSMGSMFDSCSKLTTITGIGNFNTSSVTSMSSMFFGCSSLTTITGIENFNTSSVTGMIHMFSGCSLLTSLNLSGWNTSSVTTMRHMFYNCSGLTSLNLSKFNTSVVTDMSYMFYGCSSLTSLNLSNFTTSAVTDMSYMFYGCSALTSLDLNSWLTGDVTNMSDMFHNCSKLTTLNISDWDTCTVTNMSYVFYGCSALTSLDLSNWDTSAVTNMTYMFYGCSALTELNLDHFDLTNVTNVSSMLRLGSSNKINKIVLPDVITSSYPLPLTTGSTMVQSGTQTKVVTGGYSTNSITSTYQTKTLVRANLVTANANGGTISAWSGSASSTTRYVEYDKTLSVLPTATRTGYTLKGWYTAASGGTQITTSSTFTTDATIYAQWTINKYTITINSNNTSLGTVSTATVANVPYGSTIVVNSNKITVNGTTVTANSKTFTGYTVNVAWSVTSGTTVTGNMTITATFTKTANSYTVTAVANGGTIPATDGWRGAGDNLKKEITYDSTYGTLPSASREGYDFLGWNTNTDGTGSTITSDSILKFAEPSSIYAQWKIQTFTVTLQSNNTSYGTITPSNPTIVENVPYGTWIAQIGDIKLSVYNTVVEGTPAPSTAKYTYKFDGWSFRGQVKEDVTVIFNFSREINKYTVTADANGGTILATEGWSGTGLTATKVIEYDAVYGTLPSLESRTGYTFNGWFTAASSGTKVESTTKVSTASAHTIYAQWTVNTYTVTADAGYGTVSTTSGWTNTSGNKTATKTVTYDSAYGTLPTASRTGFTTKGWALSYAPALSNTNYSNAMYSDRTTYQYGTDPVYGTYFRVNGSQQTTTIDTAFRLTGNTLIPITSGNTYRFGFYVRSANSLETQYINNSTSGYNTAVIWNTGTRSYATKWNFTNDGTWRYVYFDVTAPAGAKTARLQIGNDTPNLYGTNSYIDFAGLQFINLSASYITGATTVQLPYDHWIVADYGAITYSIVYNGNGATGGSTSEPELNRTYNVSKALTANGFVREYVVTFNDNIAGTADTTDTAKYTFAGWATSATGAKVYNDKQNVLNLASTQGATVTLYAKWTQASVTLPTLTRAGYNFLGWYTLPTGGTKVGDAGDSYPVSTTTTLYAQWSIITYNISYTLNGGTVSGTNPTTYTVETTTFTLINPTKTGYEFLGWTGSNGTTAQTTVKIEKGSIGDKSYTANWKAKTFTLTADAGDGTIPTTTGWTNTTGNKTATKQVTYDSTYGTLPTPALEGYTFNGWFTESIGGTKVETSTKVTTANNHTIYAQWTPITYTIKYDGNGATGGSTANSSHTYDVDKALTTNGFIKTGHAFIGWSLSKGGSKAYNDKQVVSNLTTTQGGTVTLYAVWQVNTFNVTVKSNDTSLGTVDKSLIENVAYGSTVTVSGNTLTLANTTVTATPKTISGYTVTMNWSIANGATITTSITITATFTKTANKYTVTADANAGIISTSTGWTIISSGAKATKVVTYNEVYGDLPTATRTGYSFVGWYTASSGGSQVTTSTQVTNAGAHTIYAQWKAIGYKVTADANGGAISSTTGWTGTGATATKTVTYDSSYGTLPTVSRTGYIFAGWFTAKTGGTEVTSSTILKTANVHSIYARWTAITYKVQFNKNDTKATGTMAEQEFVYDVTEALSVNTFIKQGYAFAGWATTATGTVAYDDKQSVLNLAHEQGEIVILYAKWTAISSVVTADAGEGTILSASGWTIASNNKTATKTVTYDSTYGALPVVERTGYNFLGWFDGTGTEVKSSTIVTAVINHTITAKWEIKKFTVTWKNEETVLETDTLVPYGTQPSYNGSTPTKAATAEFTYTFAGWDPVVSPVTKDITYVAIFSSTRNTYAITWKNFDGTVLETDDAVEYGKVPTYDGSTPTKAADAQYTYTFAGWTPTVSSVTGNAIYTAKFSTTLKSYTVTWKNGSTVIETDNNVSYGTQPSYDGSTPTKAATAQYTYTFAGWSLTESQESGTAEENLASVTGHVTYHAAFSKTVNKYTVTWKNGSTILETDENVSYGTKPSYDGSTPTKAATAQYTYTFAGWNLIENQESGTAEENLATITGHVTYNAAFSKTLNSYTVTWVNYDGTVLETDKGVNYGTVPVYNSATPTKPATDEHSFAFIGWDKQVVAVTGNVTYTAVFDSSVNSYVVTIVADPSGYGSVDKLYVTSVTYGTIISVTGNKLTVAGTTVTATPSAATVEFTYSFVNWTDGETVISGNTTTSVLGHVTITANFARVVNNYTVTIVAAPSGHGTVSHATVTEVPYGTQLTESGNTVTINGTTVTATPTQANAEFTYSFASWTNGTAKVQGNLTVTANFDRVVNTYTVTWINYDGTVLETDTEVPYGTKPSYDGETPIKERIAQYSYIFAGWNLEENKESGTAEESLETIKGHVTYHAAFSKTVNKYTVTITASPNGHGTVSQETVTEVPYGTQLTVSGNTVTINGTTVTATPTPATAQYTYTFASWTNGTEEVHGDLTVIANFNSTVNTYTITWKNEDGTVLETDENVPYGTVPAYNGETPTKEATAEFTYSHSGWTPAVESVKGNKVYTATFSSTVNEYTVVWKNDDGTVLETDENVKYGTQPSYDGETPTKKATAQYTYTYLGWTPSISNVTGDVVYTATYSSTINNYTVTIVAAPVGYGTVSQSTVTGVPYGTKLSVVGKVLTINTTEPTTITATETPATAQYTYKFESWTNGTVEVQGDVTVTANFGVTTNAYTVTWINDDSTVLEVDRNVEYGKTPTYDGETPTKKATAQYTYTYIGWTPAVDVVTGNVTYTATYSSTVNKYTVTIITTPEDYGTVSQTTVAEVPYGVKLTENGNVVTINGTDVTATPTQANAEFTYSFVGWTNGTAEVQEDLTVTANFDRVVNTYTVTWVNYNGTVLETDENVPYGTKPSYDGETPIKERIAQYSYIFAGWNLEENKESGTAEESLTEIKGNVTYHAAFSKLVNKYTVRITASPEGYGTVSQTSVVGVPYGTKITENGNVVTINGTDVTATETLATAQYTYSFARWENGTAEVQGDMTVTAIFDRVVNTYTIVWVNDNGVVLETDTNVPYGELPTYDGEDPTKESTAQYSYTYSGWTPEVINVVTNTTYTATYIATVNKYTITWINEDGTELEVDEGVEYGKVPTYDGETPTKASTAQYRYEYSGWTPAIDTVKGDTTYTATYIAHLNAYTITWQNEDGTVLEIDEFVYYGTVPTYEGETPTKEATAEFTFTHSGWTPAVESVIGDATYTATFLSTVNKYIVVWKNDDGTILETDAEVPYGTVPTYDGDTPTKKSTAQYSYEFSGWTPAVESVTGEAAYTAVYTPIVNNYVVTISVSPEGYGLVSESTVKDVPYGTKLTVVGNVLTINTTEPTTITATETAADAQYTYKFDGWTNGTATVEGNLTVFANFSRKVNGYTITWLNEDGTLLELDEGIEYGKNPSYDGSTPTKEPDVQYNYTFDKWSPELEPVTGDATYTATYSSKLNKYTVSVLDDSTGYGSIVSSSGETSITVDYGTEVSISGSVITISGVTFTATPKANSSEYAYEFKNWSNEITEVTGDITIVAYFVRLVTISIETVGVDGNVYGVDVYDSNNELLNETPYTKSFSLETNKIYTFKVVSNLILDEENNKYQILRAYVDDVYNFTQHSLLGDVDQTVCNKVELINPTTIKIEYLSAYFLKVNLAQNTISSISVTEINETENVVIKYASKKGYIVADGSELNFTVDATPVLQSSIYTFIGFNYVLNGTTQTVGVNGGTHITLKSFVHNSQYPNDRDICVYNYNVSSDYKITELTVVTVYSRVISTINTASIKGTITLTSEHGFNKVLDSSTTSIILYDATWTVATEMTLAEVQEVFTGFTVSQDPETNVITIEIK